MSQLRNHRFFSAFDLTTLKDRQCNREIVLGWRTGMVYSGGHKYAVKYICTFLRRCHAGTHRCTIPWRLNPTSVLAQRTSALVDAEIRGQMGKGRKEGHSRQGRVVRGIPLEVGRQVGSGCAGSHH